MEMLSLRGFLEYSVCIVKPTMPDNCYGRQKLYSHSYLTPMVATNYPTINLLKLASSARWLEQALRNMDLILLDHSHCELKAANNAINLMFRYPGHEKLVASMTAIAREELEHFHQVNQILADRQIPLAPLNSPPYAAALKKQIRSNGQERLLDCLLVGGLIEARSHERLGLLAAHLPDPDLAAFYRSLMASEARHFGAFWSLADTYFERSIVQTRLSELAEVESELLVELHPDPRIHS
jgi:tRNA 2-(methylsulfanyl)-N6-isopentenyladenosine37 hydroxylase